MLPEIRAGDAAMSRFQVGSVTNMTHARDNQSHYWGVCVDRVLQRILSRSHKMVVPTSTACSTVPEWQTSRLLQTHATTGRLDQSQSTWQPTISKAASAITITQTVPSIALTLMQLWTRSIWRRHTIVRGESSRAKWSVPCARTYSAQYERNH